jgi:hypothetical protein
MYHTQPESEAPEGAAAVPAENPDVHIKDAFQCTPLHVAILNGKHHCAATAMC